MRSFAPKALHVPDCLIQCPLAAFDLGKLFHELPIPAMQIFGDRGTLRLDTIVEKTRTSLGPVHDGAGGIGLENIVTGYIVSADLPTGSRSK